MSTVSLRLPNSLHKQIRQLAKREGISINQFIASATAEKMTSLLTEEYLNKRANRASRKKFQAVLNNVPDATTMPMILSARSFRKIAANRQKLCHLLPRFNLYLCGRPGLTRRIACPPPKSPRESALIRKTQ